MSYFRRLTETTPTRLWINNPTHTEARLAIDAGAIACTTNPSYTAKMLEHPEMGDEVQGIIADAIAQYEDDERAAEQVQLELVGRTAEPFAELHRQSEGHEGFVSLQSNPHTDHDAARIVSDARNLIQRCPNGIAKVPATAAGFEAIETLLAESIPVIVTEVMAISQAVYAAELYRKIVSNASAGPAYFVTHITGIFDEYVAAWSRENDVALDGTLIANAGTIVARKLYALYREREYPGILLGGGARERRHFTELVGGALHVTINWKGMAEELIRDDSPIEERIAIEHDEGDIEQLAAAVPAFDRAIGEVALAVHEFETYGPVELFRSMFVDGWNELRRAVTKEREGEAR